MTSWRGNLWDFADVTLDVVLQRWICRGVPSLESVGLPDQVAGLNVIVTGCTSGIGKAAAREFARRRCNLFLACRNAAKGEKLRRELLGAGDSETEIEVVVLDLSSLDSVVKFAKAFNARGVSLDILVNNAGVFAMSAPKSLCEDKYELHLLTNFLSNSLLTLLLLPSLLRAASDGKSGSGKAKVIMVNSKLHQMCKGFGFDDPNFDRPRSYNSKKAYAQSKLAQLLFTNALREKLKTLRGSAEEESAAKRVQLMTLHPGNVTTDVVRTLPWVVQKAYAIIMPLFLLTPEEGARSTLHAATDEEADKASPPPSSAVLSIFFRPDPSRRCPCLLLLTSSSFSLRREQKQLVKQSASTTFGYFNSNCEPVLPSAEARDEAEADRLWDWTLEEIGAYLNKQVKDYFR